MIRGTYAYTALSSANPVPNAFVTVTFPARYALNSPAHPSDESERKIRGSLKSSSTLR